METIFRNLKRDNINYAVGVNYVTAVFGEYSNTEYFIMISKKDTRLISGFISSPDDNRISINSLSPNEITSFKQLYNEGFFVKKIETEDGKIYETKDRSFLENIKNKHNNENRQKI